MVICNFKSLKKEILLISLIIIAEIMIGLGIIKNLRYTFLLLFGMPVFILFYLKPLAGLCMVIISTAFLGVTVAQIGGVGIEAIQLFSLMLSITWLMNIIVKQNILFQRTPLDLPLLIFSCWAIISLVWSYKGLSATVGLSGKIVYITILYFLFTNILTSKNSINTALWVWCFSLSLGTVFGMFSAERGIDTSFKNIISGGETGGQFSKQHFNLYVNFSIFFIIGLIPFSKNIQKKILLSLSIILGILSVLLAISLGGILSLTAGLIFIALKYKLFSKTSILSILLISLLFFGIFMIGKAKTEYHTVGTVASYFASYQDFTDSVMKKLFKKTSTGRVYIWSLAMRDFMDSYGIGIGLGRSRVGSVLNIYIQTISDFGVVGALLFLWMVAAIFKSIWRAYFKAKGTSYELLLISFCGALIMLAIFGMVDFVLYDPLVWAFLGLGMAIINVILKLELEKPTASEVPVPL